MHSVQADTAGPLAAAGSKGRDLGHTSPHRAAPGGK